MAGDGIWELVEGELVWLERYVPDPPKQIKPRSCHGGGSFYHRSRDKLWIGTVELPPAIDGKRRKKTVSSKLFCQMLRKFSTLERRPERPVRPAGSPEYRKRLVEAQKLGTHTRREWSQKLRKQDGRCHYCHRVGGWLSLEKDHMTPISRGGSDGIENLVGACSQCNCRKGAKTAEEFFALMELRRGRST